MLGLKNINNANIYSHHQEERGQRKKIEDYSYGLLDKIGKGYSSIVYKGKNDITGDIVAIKVIDLKGVKDAFGKEMLDCEIDALKTLNHSNILKCYDVYTTANNCYIITELCNEGDLAALITKKKKLSQSDAIGFIRDICLGFFEMASNSFLHRDLKLANVFLKDGVAKIADFGFAKKNKNPGQKQKYNVGSPLYMPPESLKNNIYSIKSDIWSIGIIVYELLHGQTPWQCKTQRELIEKIMRVPIRFKVSVSEQLKDFIKKCLQVDQSRRFSLQQMKFHPLIRKICKDGQIKQKEQQQVKERERGLSLMNKPSQTYKIIKKDSNKQNITSDVQNFSRNNEKMVEYINIFRLLYKIVIKLKQTYPSETILISALSSSVLNRINSLKILSENSKKTSLPQSQIGLKNSVVYFDLITNPSIKKYLRVINQYHKKYNQDLICQSVSNSPPSTSLNQLFKQFLKTNQLKQQQVMVFYWISQYLTLPSQIKKQTLENIVQPKNKISSTVVQLKIKKLIE